MGKGAKPKFMVPIVEKAEGDRPTKGCNMPLGCKLNENPPIDCSRNPDYVKVICTNDKCTKNQYFHLKCYDEWEAKIIIGVQKSQGRTRDFTDDQVRRRMWTRIWDISCRYCKCICGGYLKPAEIMELPEQPAVGGRANENKKKQQPVQQPVAAPKTPLPKLVQPKYTYTHNKSMSPWVAATGGFRSGVSAEKLGSSFKSTENLTNGSASAPNNYIPGLFVGKEKQKAATATDQRRLSTSSREESTGIRSKSTSFSSPTPPKYRPQHGLWASPPEEQDDNEWTVARCVRAGKKEVQMQPIQCNGEDESDDEDGPSTSLAPPAVSDHSYKDYKARLEEHAHLSDTTGRDVYDRDLFEIQFLLDEMNAALN